MKKEIKQDAGDYYFPFRARSLPNDAVGCTHDFILPTSRKDRFPEAYHCTRCGLLRWRGVFYMTFDALGRDYYRQQS